MKNKLLLTIILILSWIGAHAHSGGVWIANDGCGHWYAIVFHYHNNGSAGSISSSARAGLYIDYDQDGVFNVNGQTYAYTNASGFTTSNGDFQRFTDWINLTDKSMSANGFANNAATQTEVLNWLNSNKNFGKNYSIDVAIDAGTYSSTWYEALVAPIKPLSPGVYKSSTSTSSMVESPIGYSNPFDLNYTPTNFIGSVTTQSTCGETLEIDASLTQTCVEEYGLVYSLTNELPSVDDADVTKQSLWSGNATDFENEAFNYTVNVDPANEFKDHYVRTYYLQNVSGTYFYVYSPLISAMPLDPDLDCDGDGITNGDEIATSDPSKDTDGDGTPDYRDLDSNNDGVTDSENTVDPDCDEDGIKDFQDLSYDPEIQSQPSSSTICDLENTSFGVTATGGGLSYQWQVNEGSGFVDLANNDIYNNVTSSTLYITSATVGMDGFLYRCLVNSSSCNTSSTSENATLNINFVNAPATTDVTYVLEETASALSTHITGQNLTYYDAVTGGTGVVHEITPQTNNVGVTEYWVSQTVNGCESGRAKLTVTVEFPYEVAGSNNLKSSLFAINSKIDESISISGSGEITNPKVYIDAGYQQGDQLNIGIELPSGISASFDTNSGSLNFTGTASTAVWQEIFRNVMFSSTSSNTDDRTISFILENGISLKVGGKDHFYQYITGNKTWAQAKTAAEGMTFLGLQGYLATVNSQVENDFIEEKLASDGWVGGSDDYNYINAAAGSVLYANQASAEGSWYWVTGPEKGKAISSGNTSPAAVDGAFMNWNPNEPNNSSGEHYMQLYSTQNGKWNDLPGGYSLNGFVVEYGGYDNEVSPTIQHSRVISFNQEADLTMSVNSIDENSASGTVLSLLELSGIDEDMDISFSLITGDGDTDNNLFSIVDSKLVTTSILDYENNSSLSVRISAEDEYGASFEKALVIGVNNLNDNAPAIAADQSFSIDENSTQNTVVGTVSVSDVDGATTYENWTITAGNTNEAFQIDESTGEISVQTTDLDFEAVGSYTLTLTVEDGANTSATVDVVVDINNLNDNAPIIAANQSFDIDENSGQNTLVGSVSVSDADGATTYEIWTITAGNTNDAFQIDANTGEISVQTTDLDYEAVGSYTLTVTVEDGANTSASVDLTIDVNNLNDNAPVIAANQSFDLDENSAQNTVVGSVSVSDADGATTYENWTITGGNTNEAFQINANTGEISVKTTDLDYEAVSSYTLTITVEDGANTSSAVDLTIDVNNLNDNAPIIAANQSFDLDENSAQNTVVGSVSVSDADGATSYENWTITAGNINEAFQIDANTGEISVQTTDLDYEAVSSYTLTLTVQDGANTSSAVDLTITVNNLNDNAPLITANQSFDLDENSAQNTLVGSVSVSDADGATTYENWTITAGNINEAFQIDANTGEISVQTTDLDYEAVSSYTLTLTVQDGANTSSAVELTITVNNLNDNAPVIAANQSFDIDENSAQNTLVGSVSVSDADGATTYENWTITAGNTYEAFQIDANTGEISVKTTDLDYEAVGSYTLTVTVEDGANTSSAVNLTIDTNNLNDNSPVIAANQSFDIDENSAQNTLVGSVSVSDADGATTYANWTITAGNTNDAFQIDANTGEISVKTTDLDYEAVSSYTLTVTVEDGANTSASVDLTIDVNNLNDNAPVIAANQSFDIDENSGQNTLVGSVSVSDADGSTTYENWTITAGNTNEAFQIDANTGEISVKTTDLDYEAVSSYTLTVTVEDGANTSASVDLTIDVNNLNDNSPIIAAEQSFSIDENSSQNTLVGIVSVSDADGATTYENWTITAGNTNDAFQIDANTGEISVKTTDLDYEAVGSYTLTLTVQDGANTSSAVDLTIAINNLNDNAPVIAANQSFDIDENRGQNTVVGSVSVSDADGATTYENWTITAGNINEAFQINANTGEISVQTTDLDFETVDAYTLSVSVQDGANTSANVDVVVDINNLNDNAPIIASNQSFDIVENSAQNTVLGTVLVSDVDGATTYENWTITAGNTNEAFQIDASTGEISVQTTDLDFEAVGSYTLTLTVEDGVNTSASVDLTIDVNNLNDNAPIIASNQSFDIVENSAQNTVLRTVLVSDADGATTYENWTITAGNTNEAFQIDASTGEISVQTTDLDYEAVSSYTLTLTVQDGANTSASVDLTIDINNLNDNAPVIAANQSFDIDENSAQNTVVGAVAVSDADGATTYQNWAITAGNTNEAFQIDANSGELSVKTTDLDYEAIASYTLTLTVQDGANTSSAVDLMIDVSNLNDNAPVTAANQSFDIDENSSQNTVVGSVAVSDADGSTTYENWTITAGNTNDAFQIDANTGELSVKTTDLDYEAEGSYTLTLTVQDGANTSAAVNVLVNINNLNDNVPVIAANQIFSINENSVKNSLVGTVQATDADGMTQFTWSLINEEGEEAFEIDPSNGIIKVLDSALLDAEKKTQFMVEVIASDGQHEFSAGVTINILNINDNAPEIAENQSFTIDENLSNGTSVGQILASDQDAAAVLGNWEILGGNTDDAFKVDQNTGVLSVKNSAALNFETRVGFTLNVKVTDGELESQETEITIQLTDLNDVAPTIEDNISFSVAENKPNGTELGIITASDLDENTELTNWAIISGNDQNAFSINENSGLLVINNSDALDYETVSQFTLAITVSDGTNNSDVREIDITIENVNDNLPTSLSLSNQQLNEADQSGTEVGYFTTDDADLIDHFTYKLVNGEGDDDNDYFEIIGDELFTTRNLDFDYNSSLTIRVRTEDSGGEAFEANFTITVTANMEIELSIPTAFTPNGDGSNDTWEIDRMGNYPNSTIRIYNSDGIEVFRNTGYTRQWDGYYNGKLMSIGNYYYIIQLNDNTGKVYKGSVMIIK